MPFWRWGMENSLYTYSYMDINHLIADKPLHLTKTTFGRKIYITGGNKEAAFIQG